jgi:hypothetical protein
MKAAPRGRVLAFYPHARGFAYVVFNDQVPLDWGMSDLRRQRKTAGCVRRLARLLDWYCPRVLIVRDIRRSANAGAFYSICDLAGERGINVVAVSRRKVQEAFADLGRPTRYAIAQAIALELPIFAPLMPPPRKIWNGEDRRMGLFDALALMLAFQRGG